MRNTSCPFPVVRLLIGVLAASAVGLTALLGATPAQAAYEVVFTPTSGSVGTPIALASAVSSGAVGVGVGTVSYYAAGAKVAETSVDATGRVAATSWTPGAAGAVPMYAAYASTDGTQAATSSVSTVTIAKATTRTTLSLPTAAKTGVTVTLTATVTAGAYAPTGSVTFALPNGIVLASSAVGAGGSATLNVQMPAAPTTYQVKATYSGDDNAAGSASASGSVVVSTSGSIIELALSNGPYVVGTPLTISATLSPSTLAGSVTFTAGTTVIGAQPVVGGRATLTWSPTTGGSVRLAAAFLPSGSTSPTGTDFVDIAVAVSLPPNRITLGPAGQPAWTDRQGVALRFRDSITLAASSASGAAVGMAVSGPCRLVGSVLTADAGGGTCTLTSTSPQTPAYAAVRRLTTIALARAKQTATVTAPVSGRLLRGRIYQLAWPGTRTNAGTTVAWRVITGTTRCRVIRSSDGTVRLRTNRSGLCRVRASAPPVVGQYLKFQKTFRYRIR